MSSSAPRWRTVPVDALVWRQWNDEVVVRNECTGSTHLLGSLAGSILKLLLANGPGLTAGELENRLGDSLLAHRPDAGAAIEEVLGEFGRLGLAQAEAP